MDIIAKISKQKPIRKTNENLRRAVEEMRDASNKAKSAIDQKYLEVGGATGLPVGEIQNSGAEGYSFFRVYQHGVIYWSLLTGARWVYGAILNKYQELGAEASFLGFPATDETGAPDGIGRYNHFEHGSIYWTPNTGAHVIYGEIRNYWANSGWERGWLGYPISDEMDFADDGRISVFQNGRVCFWSDVGARGFKEIVVHYTGIYCFGETDSDDADINPESILSAVLGEDRDSSDEPFATIGIIGPNFKHDVVSRVYSADAKQAIPDIIELYRGEPRGMLINAMLNEYSGGDTEYSRAKFREAYETGSILLSELVTMIPLVGPVLGKGVSIGLEAIKDVALTQLNNFVEQGLGYGNRPLGQDVIALSVKDMIVLATRPEGHALHEGIPWRFETGLLTRFGASYKVYFNIFSS